MANIFQSNKGAKVKKTAFDLSHDKKLSSKFGQLIPILTEEIMPGDNFNISSEILVRTAPLKAPLMHRINSYVHYFFVPNRLIWGDWEDFITGKKTISPPKNIFSTLVRQGSIHDYLGLPSGTNSDNNTSQLPLRSYYKIWNEYYRDQNLQNEIDIENLTPAERNGDVKPLYRAWQKDYFTSALTNPQQGGNGAAVPLTVFPTYRPYSDVRNTDDDGGSTGDLQSNNGILHDGIAHDTTTQTRIENLLTTVQGAMDIKDFRVAHHVQKWLERQARSGQRYRETLLSHFNQKNDDLRMMVPQYLGGGKLPVKFSEVLNTNGNQTAGQGDENVPQGTMSGHGMSVGSTNQASQTFKEHGWVIGIMSVIPDGSYQQGIHRSWLRNDKFEYPWPEFANLGEHAILIKKYALRMMLPNTTKFLAIRVNTLN